MEQIETVGDIIAAVTIDRESVAGLPTIVARDEKERERIANYMARIFQAVVHDLENGTYLIVRH